MSTVLLKNDGVLPLTKSTVGRVVLIGPDAKTPYTAGGGSGHVETTAVVSPLDASQPGASTTFFSKGGAKEEGGGLAQIFSLSTHTHTLAFSFLALGVDVVYEEGASTEAAQAAALNADVAIVLGSARAAEAVDRASLYLDGNVDELIPLVAAACARTVVVMSVPGSILTEWRDAVPAILTNFMPGEQVGPALVDVLFGTVPPQAKLPLTFPNSANEQRMTPAQYPGVPTDRFQRQANYTEGQLVGYRWYDKHAVAPAFPFGHGLSYGTYAYGDLRVKGRTLSFKLARDDSGAAQACDTPQIYFKFPGADANDNAPAKVLRNFRKICDPTAEYSFTFTDADVSNWSVDQQRFVVTPGQYQVLVGSSSADIRLQTSFTIERP